MTSATDALKFPGIVRRIAAAAYDGLLAAAILFGAAALFVGVFGSALDGMRRHFFQAYLMSVMAAYFSWSWVNGGQTLAMKTWHLRLVSVDNGRVSMAAALSRFALAAAGLAFFGAGWWWMLFDRDGCTLHDRLTGTRLVMD